MALISAIVLYAVLWFGALVLAADVGTTLALRSYFEDADYRLGDVVTLEDEDTYSTHAGSPTQYLAVVGASPETIGDGGVQEMVWRRWTVCYSVRYWS